jgi:pimeloyl-ACP methyl ester carboxylesterase
LTELGLREPVLVGHSAAALLVTMYAAKHSVAAVVNVDQPLLVRDLAARLQMAGAHPDEQAFSNVADVLIASMGLDAVPERYRRLVVPKPRREVFLGWQRHLLETAPEVFQSQVETAAKAVSAPYLAVFSRLPWPEHDDWLRALIPQARTEIYQTGGHFPHLADASRFARSLRSLEPLPL